MDYNNQTEPQSKKGQQRMTGSSDVFKVSVADSEGAQNSQVGPMNASSGKNSLKAGLKSVIGGMGQKRKPSIIRETKGGSKLVTVRKGPVVLSHKKELDLSNPEDIQNYRNRIKSIAHDYFDPTSNKDKLFFTYLNRLLEGPELAQRELKGQGIRLLNDFITGQTAITREIKEREREKRWAKAREERLQRGENPIELKQVLNALNLIYMTAAQAGKKDDTKIEVKTMDKHGKIDMSKKNYHMSQKLGLGDRSIKGRRRWEDPNPIKYGGPTGYIALKNANDTRFQHNKKLQEQLDILTGLKPAPQIIEQPSRKVLDMTYASEFNHGNVFVPSVRSVLVEQSKEQQIINSRPRMPEIFKNKQIPESIESQLEDSSVKTGHSRNSRFSRASTVKQRVPKKLEQKFELPDSNSGERLNTHEDTTFHEAEDLLKNIYSQSSMKKQHTTLDVKQQSIQRRVHNEELLLDKVFQNQLYQQSSIFRQQNQNNQTLNLPEYQNTLSLLQQQEATGKIITKPLSKGKYQRAGYQGFQKQRQSNAKSGRVFQNMEQALRIQNDLQNMSQEEHLVQLQSSRLSQEAMVTRALIGAQNEIFDSRGNLMSTHLSAVNSNQKIQSHQILEGVGQQTADTADSQSVVKKSAKMTKVDNAENISILIGQDSTAELSQSISNSALGPGKITIKQDVGNSFKLQRQYNSALGNYNPKATSLGVFGPQSNIEATVEKVIHLDRTTENLELGNNLKIYRKNPIKYLIKHQGSEMSPAIASNAKSKQFNSLVSEIDRRVKAKNLARFKKGQMSPDHNYLINTNQIQPMEESPIQSPSKRKLSYEEIKTKFFEESGKHSQAVFTYDGLIAKNIDQIQSVKLDISKFIQKYKLPVNKFIAKLSDDHIKTQKKFNKQAYIELLESCSDALIDQDQIETERKVVFQNKRRNSSEKAERPVSPPKFKMMWTPDGRPLKTLEQLMDHIYDRWQFQESMVQTQQMLLPLIGNREEDVQKNPALILLSMQKQRKQNEFVDIKVGDQNMEGSETDETVNEKRKAMVKPSHDFVGIKDKFNQMNEREIRHTLSKDKKHDMLQINRKWSIKQQIKWIQQNHDPAGGRVKYDESNLEDTFKKDAQSDYLSSNVKYRENISKKVHQTIINSARHQIEGSGQGYSSNRAHYNKLGPNAPMIYESPKRMESSRSPMYQAQSPAFNDGTISATSIQLPQIKQKNENSKAHLKVPTQATSQLQQYSNRLIADAQFMSRDSSIQNIQGISMFEGSDIASKIGQGSQIFMANQQSIKSQQQLLANKYKPIQTPNIMNLERSKIDLDKNEKSETWNSAFLSKVETLRSKYRAPDVVRQNARKSMMQVPSVGAPKLRVQNKVTLPEKKKPKEDQKEEALDVKRLSDQYLLPSKVIYQLNSEFNCLKEIAKKSTQPDDAQPVTLPTESNDDQQSVEEGGQAKPLNKFEQFRKQKEQEEQRKKLANGIQVKTFVIQCQELQDKHSHTIERIMDALELPVNNQSTVVDWEAFLKLKTVLKYFTATKDQYLEFWMKFLNPQKMPTLPKQTFYIHLELLARGSFTSMPTLISEQFAEGFIKMLDNRGCMIKREKRLTEESDDESSSIQMVDQNTILAPEVDMVMLKNLIKSNKIDIEYLNQCLKSDNQYVMEGDDDDL